MLLATFWLACFVATHLPKVPQAVGRVSDKTWHFAAYGVLAYLLSWALTTRFKGVLKCYLIAMAILATYAAIDEVLQIPVGRRCDLDDWIADMIGALCGCALLHLVLWLWRWRTCTKGK